MGASHECQFRTQAALQNFLQMGSEVDEELWIVVALKW
jgi:hypothetical protein